MFKSSIRITGKHARIAQKYSFNTNAVDNEGFVLLDSDGKNSAKKRVFIFDTLVNCIMTAMMIGIAEDRTAEEDKGDASATVFADMLAKKIGQLERIYQHMVLIRENDLSDDEKIKRAFGILPDNLKKTELDKLKRYLYGGLEIIDELFSQCSTVEDFCNAIIDFKIKYNLEDNI